MSIRLKLKEINFKKIYSEYKNRFNSLKTTLSDGL